MKTSTECGVTSYLPRSRRQTPFGHFHASKGGNLTCHLQLSLASCLLQVPLLSQSLCWVVKSHFQFSPLGRIWIVSSTKCEMESAKKRL